MLKKKQNMSLIFKLLLVELLQVERSQKAKVCRILHVSVVSDGL